MALETVAWWALWAIFAVGLVLIVKGGDAFVDAACWMAEVSGIPQFIVGATVVSVATTLPELLVSLLAALNGDVDIAVGNAVGSVTANTGLILAIGLLAMPGRAPRRLYWAKGLLFIAAVGLLWFFTREGNLQAAGSLALAGVFALFIAENLHRARADATEAAALPRQRPAGREVAQNLLYFALGAAGIVAGAELLVHSADEIAVRLAVPDVVIAVTIVAVGTSLPELVTTLTAIAKGQSSLSAGNILGANIIDTALILPLCGAASHTALPINSQTLHLDLPVCMGCVLLAVVPVLLTGRFRRWQGLALLAVYAGYLAMVLA